MAWSDVRRGLAVLLAAAALSGCGEGKGPFGLAASAGGQPKDAAATRLVERDVEAPEIFQMAEDGLWDGRPSLGAIWVAHAKAKDPQRVIIRNEANGKFVIGALFRRERDVPGPKFQVSSDAAEALGLSAGTPVRLHVTALRREEAATAASAVPAAGAAAPQGAAEPVAPPPAGLPPAPAAEATLSTSQAPAVAAAPAKLDAPYLQIGIFAVEENANRAAKALRAEGLAPRVQASQIGGKAYWRVLVGPAKSAADRAAGLTKVKALGYIDAYAVKG